MHTPGPWKVIDRRDKSAIKAVISDRISVEDFPFEIYMPSPPFVLGACGALIARKGGFGNEGTPEATAHLMSAAPELLDALLFVKNHCRLFGAVQAAREKIGAALAKADGQPVVSAPMIGTMQDEERVLTVNPTDALMLAQVAGISASIEELEATQ
jgi:hypothetical protein